MQIRFEDIDLERMHGDAGFRCRRFGSDIARAIRRILVLIEEVPNQRDLYQFKSLRLEKLKGNRAGQYSMRLNDQFRLIVRFETIPNGQVCVVIEVVDYH